MKTPKITLAGKQYKANKPSAGIFRKIIKFNSNSSNKNLALNEDAYDEILTLIVEGFSHPAVTIESIEAKDGLPVDEVMPKFKEIATWVSLLFAGKVAEIPKAQTPAGI